MRIAILTTAVGSPGTLATTTLIGTLAGAFGSAGVATRVFGLTKWAPDWVPGMLGQCNAVAPWLSPAPANEKDRREAVWLGIVRGTGPAEDDRGWYDELLLHRTLTDFAAGERRGLVMVFPRSQALLEMAQRAAGRIGWNTLAVATEALTGDMIDPSEREAYVRSVSSGCAGVWAVSGDLAEYWALHGVSRDRIHVAPTVVRPELFAISREPTRTAEAVFLGNLVREFDYLLEITALVRARIPEFHLTVYGDADDSLRASREQEIATLGLSHSLSIRSAVAPADVPDVLRTADVVVLPRSMKGPFPPAGFPQKLGEYLAVGCPTVVTSVRDVNEYLSDGVNAFVVPPDDCHAFADAVVKCLSDPQQADLVAARGRDVAERFFSTDVFARRAIVFFSALGSRRATIAGPGRLTAAGGLAARDVRALAARCAETLCGLARSASGTLRTFARWVKYSRHGYTRIVAVKIAIVRVLWWLHLKRRPESHGGDGTPS